MSRDLVLQPPALDAGEPLWSVTLPIKKFCEPCRVVALAAQAGEIHGFIDICANCRAMVKDQVRREEAADRRAEADERREAKKRKQDAIERPWRDAVIWLMRRGDGLSLPAIAKEVGLSVEGIRNRLRIMDARLTPGWLFRDHLASAPPPWVIRLRDAGALAPILWRHDPTPYEAFNSTAPRGNIS